MCGDYFGGGGGSQRRVAMWQAEQAAAAAAENERQRVAAQADMERRLQEQMAREAAIVAEQQRTAQAATDSARADEAARQNMITGNRGKVDEAFAGFNDDFYKASADKYTAAYLPKLEEDRLKSLDQLKAALAGRGTLESTVGINTIADFEKKAAEERAAIASRGSDFANSIREKVGASKNSLYEAAGSAADPQGFAARATGEATNLVNMGGIVPFGQPTAYGSQADPNGVAAPQNSSVFGGILAPLIGAGQSALNAPRARSSVAQAINAPTSGSGTSTVRQ
jgi:hypothetical protein